MWQIDHETGIAPRGPFGHATRIKHHNPVRGAQLRQTTCSGEPCKARTNDQPIGACMLLETNRRAAQLQQAIPCGGAWILRQAADHHVMRLGPLDVLATHPSSLREENTTTWSAPP